MRSTTKLRLRAACVAAITFYCFATTAYAQGKVVATIKPVHTLVAQVMGDTGVPDLLVDGSASPHGYIMRPSDAAKLAAAAVVFRVSPTIEPFTVKATRMLAKSAEMVTLQSAPGVATLPQRLGGPFDAHDHEHDHDADGHNAGTAIDGHVWLNPDNAKAMLDEIARRLAAHAPANAAAYATNAAAAKARIDALSADLAKQLSTAADRPYVVFHDAYQYFEKRFGLKAVGAITVDPEVPPSGKRLSSLRLRISSLGALCVFGEPNFDSKIIAAVTEGTKARSGILDPEGAALVAGPDLYDRLMRNLASDLAKCLAPPA